MNAIEPIYPSDLNDALISDLSNRPNSTADDGQDGLTAKQLKERFDKYPRIVMDKLNDIIRAFNSDDATSYVKMPSNDLGESFCDFLSYFDPNNEKDIGDLVCAEYMMEDEDEKKKYTLNKVLDGIAYHIKNVGAAIAEVKTKIEELASQSDQVDSAVVDQLSERIGHIERLDSELNESIVDLNSRAATLEAYINAGGGNLPPGSEIGDVLIDRQTAYVRTVPDNASTTALLDRYYGESEVVCNYSPVAMKTMTGQNQEFTIFAYPPGNIENLELSISASLPPEENGVYGAYGLEILVNGNYVYNEDHPYIYDEKFSVEFAVGDLAPEVKIKLFTAPNAPPNGTVSLYDIRLVKAGSKRGATGISTIQLNSIESSTGDTVEIPNFGYNDQMYSVKYVGFSDRNYVDFSEKYFSYKTRYFYDELMTGWEKIDKSTVPSLNEYKVTYFLEDLKLPEKAIIASASSTYGNAYKDGVTGARVFVYGTYIEVRAYVNAALDSLTAFLEYMRKIRFGIIYTLSDAESNADIVLQPIDPIDPTDDQSFVEIPVEPGGTLTFHSDKEGQPFDATIFYLKAKDEEEEPPEGGGEDPTPPEGGGDDGRDDPPTVEPEETPPAVLDTYWLKGQVGSSVNDEQKAYQRRVPSNVATNAEVYLFYYDSIMNLNIAPENKFDLNPSTKKEIVIYPDQWTTPWEVSFDVDLDVSTLLVSVYVGYSKIAEYEAIDIGETKHSFTFNYSQVDYEQSDRIVKIVFSLSSASKSYTVDNLCILPSGERRTTRTGHPISIVPTRFVGANGSTIEIPAIERDVAKRVSYVWETGTMNPASHYYLNGDNPRIEGRVELYTDDPYDASYPWYYDAENSSDNVNVYYKNIPASYFVGSISNFLSLKPNVFTTNTTSNVTLGFNSSQHGDGIQLKLHVHKSLDTIEKFRKYLKDVKFNFLIQTTSTISLSASEIPVSRMLEVEPNGIITIESNVLYHPITSNMKYVIANESGGDSGGEDPTPPEGGDEPSNPDDGGDDPTPPEGGDEPTPPEDLGVTQDIAYAESFEAVVPGNVLSSARILSVAGYAQISKNYSPLTSIKANVGFGESYKAELHLPAGASLKFMIQVSDCSSLDGIVFRFSDNKNYHGIITPDNSLLNGLFAQIEYTCITNRYSRKVDISIQNDTGKAFTIENIYAYKKYIGNQEASFVPMPLGEIIPSKIQTVSSLREGNMIDSVSLPQDVYNSDLWGYSFGSYKSAYSFQTNTFSSRVKIVRGDSLTWKRKAVSSVATDYLYAPLPYRCVAHRVACAPFDATVFTSTSHTAGIDIVNVESNNAYSYVVFSLGDDTEETYMREIAQKLKFLVETSRVDTTIAGDGGIISVSPSGTIIAKDAENNYVKFSSDVRYVLSE